MINEILLKILCTWMYFKARKVSSAILCVCEVGNVLISLILKFCASLTVYLTRGKEDKCNAFLALYLCEAEFCDGTGNQQSEDSALLSSAGYWLVCIISRPVTSLYLFFHFIFHHYKQLFSNWMLIVVSKALFWCLEWYQWCLE